MAITVVRSAVAPVAHALATLNTGMPVWPMAFWSCWPSAPPPNRLPAARIPMSFMVTPASPSAPSAASAASSTVVWSGCLPNFVMWIPRIQTSPLLMSMPPRARALRSRRFEAEADGLGASAVGADGERRQANLHAELHMLGVGGRVHDVGAHAGAVAVDHRRDERHRDAGRGQRDDRERAHL